MVRPPVEALLELDPYTDRIPLATLESWLARKPDAALVAAWKGFVKQLAAELAPDARRALRNDVLGRAERVAEAAGGILGAAAISGKERDKLYELDHAFG